MYQYYVCTVIINVLYNLLIYERINLTYVPNYLLTKSNILDIWVVVRTLWLQYLDDQAKRHISSLG